MLNRTYIIIIPLICSFQLAAQNNTKSLYSFYGLGELQNASSVAGRTLGGSYMGIAPGNFPNLLNPLSLSGRKVVDFEMGLEANYRIQSTNNAARTDWAGNVSYLSLAYNTLHKAIKIRDSSGRVKKTIPLRYNQMLGVAPFAAMDYDFSIAGDTNTFRTLLTNGGKGSLNSIYYNHALQFFDTQFTLGFGYQYVFGTYVETSLKNLLNDTASVGIESLLSQRVKGRLYSLSLGYQGYLSKKIGLKHSVSANYRLSNQFSNNAISLTRTVEDFFTIKDTFSYTTNAFNINMPSVINIGYGLQFKNLWALSFQYDQQKMSAFINPAKQSNLTDIERMSIGLQINPNRLAAEGKTLRFYKTVEWRAGFFYQSGPYSVKINNILTPIKEYGINFGAGIPVIQKIDRKNYASYVNIGLQYSARGNSNNGLLRENIFRVNLSMHLSDLWFRKFNYN